MGFTVTLKGACDSILRPSRAALVAVIAAQVDADPGFGAALGRSVAGALASTVVQQTILTVYGYEQATALE